MMELLHIPAFSRAIIALFASGLAFPLLGIYIFSLELIPARFGVMHLSLLGATVGLILGVDPVLFAMLFSVAAGFAISGLSVRRSGGTSGQDNIQIAVKSNSLFFHQLRCVRHRL